MAQNGISTLATKELRQIAKLNLAQTKRQAGGDTTKPYYRTLNVYDITLLPTRYVGNTVVDNPNIGGLQQGRPWLAGGGGSAPELALYTEDGRVLTAQDGRVIILNVPVLTEDGFTMVTEDNEPLQVE